MAQNVSKTTTDHDTIRRWVEERGGWPAEVEATAGEDRTGIIRIDFPGWSGEGKLRRIEWDEWFRKFDDAALAFVYEEETAGGVRSNFNKLVGRETAEARSHGVRSSRRASGRGAGARGRTAKTAGAARTRTASRGGAGKMGARAGARKTASRGAAGRKVGGAARRKPRAGGRRVASRSAAARTARGASRAEASRAGGRGGKRRGGGRAARRSK